MSRLTRALPDQALLRSALGSIGAGAPVRHFLRCLLAAVTACATLGTAAGECGAQTAENVAGVLPEAAIRALTVAAGYVTPASALADDGEVLASTTEGDIAERSLTVFDVIHVDPTFDGRTAAIGDSLLVYRDRGDLRHPESDDVLGRVVYPTGIAVVTSLEGDVASAVITHGFAPVVAGQRVQYLRERQSPLPAGERLLGEGLVVGFRERVAILEPYSVIYLDLSAGSDLRAGEEVRLVRPASEEGRELPEIEIGTARVLDVGQAAATALVLELARSDLEVGDRYRSLSPGP
jgi:hypothetical protein